MKTLLVHALVVAAAVSGSFSSWAGGEVPWPKEAQQDILLRDLTGVWVSQHLDSPKMVYYFSLERGGISDACPYILRVFDVDPVNGKLLTAGGGVFCSTSLERMSFVMYDELGRARNYLNIVGLVKTGDIDLLGLQWLGITLSTFSQSPQVLVQDTFYKMSL